jgi:predicted dehydrogenase
VILLEHRWAIEFRDAVARAGGFPISDGFIHPLDLVAVGLMAAEDAEALAASPS